MGFRSFQHLQKTKRKRLGRFLVPLGLYLNQL